jgi:outer membrane protein OmpA-like peptidoglycan-associated protein
MTTIRTAFRTDLDSIPDVGDTCPNEPEDRDGFKDEDGCPDPDNDLDSIPDVRDKCPIEPEDKDGFEDEDGCPDYDNDKDSIPDNSDKCPNKPENKNGYKDEDGCPDEKPQPTEKEEKALHKDVLGISFKTGSAALTDDSYAHLRNVAQFLKKYGYLQYEIQGHTDAIGKNEYNLLLSAARAMMVLKFLQSKGIPDSQVIAIGYGETKPIASNRKAKGRAKNRRVQFEPIRSPEEFSRLKVLEADFKKRIMKAKIRGTR